MKVTIQRLAELVCEMFDGVNPVWTKHVAERLRRNYHTVKTHLHLAAKQGVLKRVDRGGCL